MQSEIMGKMGNNGHNFSQQKEDGKIFGVSKHLDEEQSESSSEQLTNGISLRKHVAASPRQQHLRVKDDEQAQEPLSSASYCSSMEMAPYRPAFSPKSSLVSKGKFGESSQSLKTSTELLRVLNRIWSLEEKHALDMSLVKTLRRELDQSEARIQELLQEKKRDQKEIDNLTKQMMEYKVTRRKEQDRVKDSVKLVENKLEDELKLRRQSEKLHHKLAKELSETKSSFSNALRELEQERKARKLLEDLCDEFANGIRDYEREVRFLKQKSYKDQIGREGNDRLILHFSEAWLDERTQMKLADTNDVSDQESALDKLCLEIEAFLQAKQSGHSGKNVSVSPKSPSESDKLESFHLQEPGSAPWDGHDEDDSASISNQRPIPKMVKKKHNLVNEESRKSRTENLQEMEDPRMNKKGERMQKSTREHVDLQDTTEDMKLRYEKICMEGSFDPSTFAGPPSPVKKWTSEVSAMGPDIVESSSRSSKTMKPNTLKAKLMEARTEGQQSRTRTSKGVLALAHIHYDVVFDATNFSLRRWGSWYGGSDIQILSAATQGRPESGEILFRGSGLHH
ncbi:hypothetical protein CDL12_00685 [Handroanthus impetiginosus]|uniref:Uncharacterized protein n=1 Tax=Handroanthus impetiginosus TaxID=429701 RepID=A0A2G9I9X3_9LAMI|nr:hypothetical protein CDL12_00685 [Handroanthus impetiginosus]